MTSPQVPGESPQLPLVPPIKVVQQHLYNLDPAKAAQRRLLDAGCGIGRNALAAANAEYGVVVGVDTDAAVLAEAAQRARQHGLTACQFMQRDLDSAGELGVFDTVFANEIFHTESRGSMTNRLGRLQALTTRGGTHVVSGYVADEQVRDSLNQQRMLPPGFLARFYIRTGWRVEFTHQYKQPVRLHGGRERMSGLEAIIARRPH